MSDWRAIDDRDAEIERLRAGIKFAAESTTDLVCKRALDELLDGERGVIGLPQRAK